MIEVWLLFTMMIPFLQVIILTVIHLNTTDESVVKQASLYTVKVQPQTDVDEEMTNRSMQKTSLLKFSIFVRDFFIPISILMFFIVYMSAGLYAYNT